MVMLKTNGAAVVNAGTPIALSATSMSRQLPPAHTPRQYLPTCPVTNVTGPATGAASLVGADKSELLSANSPTAAPTVVPMMNASNGVPHLKLFAILVARVGVSLGVPISTK
jgi:hypothetical protein